MGWQQAIGLLLALLSLTVLVFALALLRARGGFCCPWWAITGFACPLCGGTRAILSLCRSELGVALGFNPLVVLALPLWLAYVMGRAFFLRHDRLRDWNLFSAWLFFILFVVNWSYVIFHLK